MNLLNKPNFLKLNGPAHWIHKFTILIVIIVSLSGCAKTNRNFESLYLRIKNDPSSLDPAYIVDVTSGNISAKLFNGLVLLNETMDIIPDIAESYTISDDLLTYTFYLHKDVSFSNGRQVTAADFKYSFERVLLPSTASSRKWIFENIQGALEFIKGQTNSIPGIQVVNSQQLQITLTKPSSLFLTFLTMPSAYVVPKEEIEKQGKSFSNNPCGTGPFILKDWKHDNAIELIRNKHYFKKIPELKNIVYKIIPEDLSAVSLFNQGEIDILEIPRSEFSYFKNNKKWAANIIEQLELNSYYLGLNCAKTPFNNQLIREAVNYAIDKEKIIKTVLEGRAIKSHGPIPPGLKGYNLDNKKYFFDPEKAKELIRQSGVTNLTIKLYQNSDKEVLNITSIVQHYLKQVGFEVQIIQRDWSAFKEAINKGEADIFYLSWWADYPDAENFLFPLFHSKNFGSLGNRAFFQDEQIDNLLEQINTLNNPQERTQLYQQIEAQIIEKAPWVFLWHRKSYLVHQPWVKNYKTYLLYNMDKGTDITINIPTA